MRAPPKPLVGFRFSSETLAGLIYGMVTAMAVIAALADSEANILFMAGAAFLTSLALALTFVFSHWLAGSFAQSTGHDGVRKAWSFELPTLVGSLVLGIVMIVESALGIGVVVAAEAAMWVGAFLLFFFGYRIALMGGRSYRGAVAMGVLDASIGASIVLIKVLVH
jgi:hypothetical protein